MRVRRRVARTVPLLAAPVLAAALSGAAGGLLAPGPAAAADREVAFQFQDDRIKESSGLAVSARHDGVVYTHNDSSGGPVLYAVDDGSGRTRAALTLDGAPARDWEALAACEDGDGRPVLWVGDIGDNIDGWRTYRLLRVPEPAELADGEVPWTQFTMRYADGRARDAEALLCHPRTGRLYVVSKESSAAAAVYRGPATMRTGTTNVFSRVGAAPGSVTDAAFLPDGDLAVLRGYTSAQIVHAGTWRTVASFTPPVQMQGETVAATPDGEALLFGSEGLGSSVWRMPVPDDVADLARSGAGDDAAAAAAADKPRPRDGEKDAKGERSPRPRAVDPDPVGSSEGIPGVDGQMVALVAALLLGALVLVLITRRE